MELLRKGLSLFGLDSLADQQSAPDEIVALATRRQEARGLGVFDEADRLREEVEAAGWQIRDKPNGFDLVPL